MLETLQVFFALFFGVFFGVVAIFLFLAMLANWFVKPKVRLPWKTLLAHSFLIAVSASLAILCFFGLFLRP